MVFPCPHCRTQNFAGPARLRTAKEIPLMCWKCGKNLGLPQALSKKQAKNRGKVKKR